MNNFYYYLRLNNARIKAWYNSFIQSLLDKYQTNAFDELSSFLSAMDQIMRIMEIKVTDFMEIIT